MKKISNILLLAFIIVFSCTACSNDESHSNSYDDGYTNGYSAGYEEGYEEGESTLFDVMNDELLHEEQEKAELFSLLFSSVYDGKILENNESWIVDNFELKYHFEQKKYLYFDIKFSNFDIKTICTGDMHDFIDKMPAVCYIGSYDKYGDYTVRIEKFVGEKIFFDEYEFTQDGYLTDYIDYYDAFYKNQTLDIVLVINGKAHAATYSIN